MSGRQKRRRKQANAKRSRTGPTLDDIAYDIVFPRLGDPDPETVERAKEVTEHLHGEKQDQLVGRAGDADTGPQAVLFSRAQPVARSL